MGGKHEHVLRGGTDLNPVGAVGVFGEVGAACMTRRNILDTIRATHRVEGTGRTGAVGVAQGQRPLECKETESQTKTISELMFE